MFNIIKKLPKSMPSLPKTTLCILLLALIVLAVNGDKVDPNYSYDDFMKHFNRTYRGEEKILHEAIFNRNYAELVQKIENG